MNIAHPNMKSEAGEAWQGSANPSRFSGTDNARHLRAIHALLSGPVMREQLDRIVGTSNSPQTIARLRDKGLSVPCERMTVEDRDGKPCHPGRYYLTSSDRLKLLQWLADMEVRA